MAVLGHSTGEGRVIRPPLHRPAAAPRNVHEAVSPHRDRFLTDVLEGLGAPRKHLPCKYFYDRRGSELFDRICDLPEYYLTRTETSILQARARAIAHAIGEQCMLIEYGSGSSTKTRILLDHLRDPAGYVPIDIAQAHLSAAARGIELEYPSLRVLPVCADYTRPLPLPPPVRQARRRVVFFPGSTLGNFEPDAARAFLHQVRDVCGPGGGLLIGIDLKKDPSLLRAAYNDSAGVTAAFNLNLLQRINRELDGEFDLSQFSHHAFYNPGPGRVEMHLLSLRQQEVQVAGVPVHFDEFENVFTESSYKYTPRQIDRLMAEAGFHLERRWMDERRWFSVNYLRVA
jgi:dimethylhistidine N-methyltransferase